MAMLVAVLWLCKLGGYVNTSVAVLICQINFLVHPNAAGICLIT